MDQAEPASRGTASRVSRSRLCHASGGTRQSCSWGGQESNLRPRDYGPLSGVSLHLLRSSNLASDQWIWVLVESGRLPSFPDLSRIPRGLSLRRIGRSQLTLTTSI